MHVCLPLGSLCRSVCVCVGCRALVFPATPFTVPQNRVAEGVASLALARPGTVQSVRFVVEATGHSDPRLLGDVEPPQALLGMVILKVRPSLQTWYCGDW